MDVRLVSATNQDLRRLIAEGRFRQDLYFRLNVFTIQVPPLRERVDDALLLAYHFLRQFAADLRKDVRGIAPAAQTLLRRYAFPGNVRELRNLIERAVILCEGESLTEREFPDLVGHGGEGPPEADEEWPLNLAGLEERAIREALRRADGNQTEAARALGIGHDALRYRMKKYGI